jgi:predicted acyltransferase
MKPSERLLSLDVFRGITIMGMILVNNPGTWGAVYPPLLACKMAWLYTNRFNFSILSFYCWRCNFIFA